MLTHDATIAMPPQPTWYRGREAVATFLRAGAFAAGTRWRLLPVTANGQLAFGEYRWNETAERFVGEAGLGPTRSETPIARNPPFPGPGRLAPFGILGRTG